MAYLINRQYKLVVGDSVSGDALDIDNLQVTFDINKSSSNRDKTNSASIEIYNLSDEDLKLLDVDYPAAVFSAGYRDIGIKRLFAGQVTDLTTRKSGTDRITQIQMGAAYTTLNHELISRNIPAGTARKAFEELAKEIGVTRTVFNSVNMNAPIIYGYPLSGTKRQMLDELSEKYGVSWQVDDDVLYVHDNDRANTENFDDAFVISGVTGLIDNAYRTSGDARRSAKDKAKKQSVQWKMLLNPDLVPGDIVFLEDTLITGWVKLTDIRHTGDWRGGAWWSECRATAIEKVSRS